jgi:hypothetical protein
MPRIALAVAALLAAGFVFVVLMLTTIHGPVTEERLANSVADEAGRLRLLPCTAHHGRPRRYSCGVWIDHGRFTSGGVDYDVRVRPGSSCWTGTLDARDARDAGVPRRLHGCVYRWQLGF